MSCPFFPTVALPQCTSVKFEIPCGNRTVNFASISSSDIVFPSNVISTEGNGAFVLAEHYKICNNQTYTCINKCSHENTHTLHTFKFTHIHGMYKHVHIYVHTLSKQQWNNRDKKKFRHKHTMNIMHLFL